MGNSHNTHVLFIYNTFLAKYAISFIGAMVQAELNLAKLQKELATARNDLMQGEQSTDLLKERQVGARYLIVSMTFFLFKTALMLLNLNVAWYHTY